MIVPRLKGRVAGEIYHLYPGGYSRALADCDELEGVTPATLMGDHYRRLRVMVTAADGETAAWAYVHCETPDDWPQQLKERRT
jgi:gamma-glutamylcyclotransferase (GGCT)/AIG2-like uncharacterized protein YtfP